MESLITISGPRGAGKEFILNSILSSQYGGLLNRIVPFTTRKMRDCEQQNREYHFISMEEYSQLQDSDLAYSVQIGVEPNHYFSGTLKSEINKYQFGITDITVEGAQILAPFAKNSLRLFVFASQEERLKRIIKRQNMSKNDAILLMQNEPSPAQSIEEAMASYQNFLVLNNHNGVEIKKTLSPVYDYLSKALVL